ncbi:hypothetical protein C7974DRAFT_380816 [Boeremia exigua]|uniref:uncharacterized protein n=1 Tax=Boeremia exigua TaxID=749465 RepID=UPI001E8EAE6E|nr:uncharacterized protein C7974DRAFT_380816 [Boeremia exigua]KAH6613106.1 hypothetical protein C7974DRAFT_380816 [Boeremia exigua]
MSTDLTMQTYLDVDDCVDVDDNHTDQSRRNPGGFVVPVAVLQFTGRQDCIHVFSTAPAFSRHDITDTGICIESYFIHRHRELLYPSTSRAALSIDIERCFIHRHREMLYPSTWRDALSISVERFFVHQHAVDARYDDTSSTPSSSPEDALHSDNRRRRRRPMATWTRPPSSLGLGPQRLRNVAATLTRVTNTAGHDPNKQRDGFRSPNTKYANNRQTSLCVAEDASPARNFRPAARNAPIIGFGCCNSADDAARLAEGDHSRLAAA